MHAADRTLALALRRLRQERGISQEALAVESHITLSTLSRIERARNSPTWSTVVQIAQALDITLAELAAAVESVHERPPPAG